MVSNTSKSKSPTSLYIDASKNIDVAGTKELKNKVLQVALTFHTSEFGKITVRGFRVSPSIDYEGYWSQPPRVKVFGSYLDLCRTEEGVWKLIEQILISTYKDHFSIVDEEDIDIESIDIGET